MAKSTRTSTAADVRAWATEQGITEGFGSRGRFSPDVIKRFNAAHRSAPYAEGNVKTVEVKVPAKDSRGRNRTATVRVSVKAARQHAIASGEKVATRGRLPESVLLAYAATQV